jgi:hypothetical protein
MAKWDNGKQEKDGRHMATWETELGTCGSLGDCRFGFGVYGRWRIGWGWGLSLGDIGSYVVVQSKKMQAVSTYITTVGDLYGVSENNSIEI